MQPIYNLVCSDKAAFDMATLTYELDARPLAFRDPVGLSVKLHPDEITFVIAPTLELARQEEARLATGWYKDSGPYALGYITLRPKSITVNQFTITATLEQMKAILIPIIECYDYRIINEYNLDLTEEYRLDLNQLFGG